MLNFRVLRTPPGDGDVLVEPPLPTLSESVQANRAHLAAMTGGLGRTDWATLRRQARAALGVNDDAPLILTGHQPEFMHAGVWAKYVVAHRLAADVGGRALNLVVDNDVPRTLTLTVPIAHGDDVVVHRLPFAEPEAGRPYESLPPLAPTAIAGIRERAAGLLGDRYPASPMAVFLDGFDAPEARSIADQMAAGRRAVDRLFGLSVADVRVSDAWGGAMLADWVLRAREFAEAYNKALAEYRREHRVRGLNRPIPDLRIDGRRVELPVWAYGPGEPRQRLYVEHDGGRCGLFVEDEPAGCVTQADLERDRAGESAAGGPVAGAARSHGALACVSGAMGRQRAIRPRALALTIWARLLASDLFIHGIGGAKYDRITDAIIRTFYGVEPPAMACVSATLLLPLPRRPVTDAELAAARRWLRDVLYQPDRWASGMVEAAPLLADRQAAIARSDELRRIARGRTHHTERAQVWERIRDLNHRILALRPTVAADAKSAISRLEQMRNTDRIRASREYFFALLTYERLRSLCTSLFRP